MFGVTAYSEAAFSTENSNVIAYPQGISLTGLMGEESNVGNANVNVTGNQSSFVSGGAVAGASALITLTGSQLTTSIGEETVNISVDITGIELSLTNKTFSQDTLTTFAQAPFATLSQSVVEVPSVEIEGTTGAGQLPSFLLQPAIGDSSILGDALVNVTGTGLALSTNDVSFEITADIDVAGIPANFTLGPYSVSGNGNIGVIVTEHTINTSINSVITSANADVVVTGSALSISIGDEEAFSDVIVSPTGIALAIAEPEIVVDLNTPVDVTGSSLAIAIGNQTTFIDVTVEVTGTPMTYALGNVIPESKYSVDGIPLSTAINSVSITGNGLVELTGIGLTQEIGPFNVIAWAEVDVGTPVVWTPVDLAA
tara:strand:- start:1 stop:1110 length:1110 start_codon:yes stop_codon:yes gene_type:complete